VGLFFFEFLIPFLFSIIFLSFWFLLEKVEENFSFEWPLFLKAERMIHSGLGPYKRENTITCIAIGLALPTTAGHIIWLSHLYQSDLFAYIYSTVLFLFSFKIAHMCLNFLLLLLTADAFGSFGRRLVNSPDYRSALGGRVGSTTKKGAHTLNKSAYIRKRMKRKIK
jgi:hypothetical protein